MPTQPAIVGNARLGNFRLGYQPDDLTRVRQARVRITLNGIAVRDRVRRQGFTIHDVINDAPNTCQLVIEGEAPQVDQAIRVTVNSNEPKLLFNGTIQSVTLRWEGQPDQLAYDVFAIDDTARANARLPFGSWTNVSATTVAQELVETFAPAFTATHVQADLPLVSVNFDGTEGMNGAMRQLAALIGGYFYWEDFDLHLFQEEATDAPVMIDGSGRLLCREAQIHVVTDTSQIRTRVYGKGHAEAVPIAVAAGETVIPVANAAMYNAAGGQAIAALTPDSAATEILSYTGVVLGGAGTIIGPGSRPPVPPAVALAAGSGLSVGTYQYAFTDVTAAGETLPSPLASITTGVTSPPSTAPTPGAVALGPGVDLGTHDYVVTFTNASGETTASPTSAAVTIVGPVASPAAAPTIANDTAGSAALGWAPGDTLFVQLVYATGAGGLTLPTANSNSVVATLLGGGQAHGINVPVVASPDARVSQVRIYINRNGAWIGYLSTANQTFTAFVGNAQIGGSPPFINTAEYQQIPVSIPLGPPAVTGRKLYRRFNFGSFLLAQTIANNSATVVFDTVPNSSLGGLPPSTNTATAEQVAISSVAVGPAGTTQRKIYRTAVNGSQLKLQQTIANNISTTGVTDTTPDGSLGANAPTSDTSGLTQPAGQVNAGSTSILTAGLGTLPIEGWVVMPSGELVRYTGISGNSLIGIPASGPGSLPTTVFYGDPIVPAPALTGVTGLTQPLEKGSLVHVWVQRDDLDAQAALAARSSTAEHPDDGIIEYLIVDERRNEQSLTALCDADLALFSRPILTVPYATRDTNTKSGKPVTFDLESPAIHDTLTIQEVIITEIDRVDGLAPKFTASASSVRFSLEDVLRRLAAG